MAASALASDHAALRALLPKTGCLAAARPLPQTVVVDADSPKAKWTRTFPSGPPLRDELARLVDSDGGNDEAENGYFESANDPQFVATESAQRRFKGQLHRRLRHRNATARKRKLK